MSRVWSCNEWDPLEEVIVGNPLKARYPTPRPAPSWRVSRPTSSLIIPRGPFPPKVIEETDEDLNAGRADSRGRRDVAAARYLAPRSRSRRSIGIQGYYNYCPRDIMLVMGDQIIETPNVIRGRHRRPGSYRRIMIEYLDQRARWYSAPKPMLLDCLFEEWTSRIPPAQRRACLRRGKHAAVRRDLIYSVSATGNETRGGVAADDVATSSGVHTFRTGYSGSHIDSTSVAPAARAWFCATPVGRSDETLPSIVDAVGRSSTAPRWTTPTVTTPSTLRGPSAATGST